MAARPEAIPARPAWYEGRFARWLTTTDHKLIGALYVSTALLSLVLGGILTIVMRTHTRILSPPRPDIQYALAYCN